jgi:hypothetical protein
MYLLVLFLGQLIRWEGMIVLGNKQCSLREHSTMELTCFHQIFPIKWISSFTVLNSTKKFPYLLLRCMETIHSCMEQTYMKIELENFLVQFP